MQKLPTNMFFAGRNITSLAGKGPYQITYVPKNQRPLSNGDNQGLELDGYTLDWGENSVYESAPGSCYSTRQPSNLWYPSCRPLKQWRKRGTTTSLNTHLQDKCCLDSQIRVGPSFKMLGKNEHGENKQLNSNKDCVACDPTRGPSSNGKGTVINFNGSSNIISASTIVPKTYYQSYKYYLKARGNLFDVKSIVHKIPNVNYMKDGNSVRPEQTQQVSNVSIPVNSSYYYGNSQTISSNVTESKNCNLAIYKPSNSQFSVQGAVDSSTRIQRLQYNTITKNNQSFYQNSSQGINLMYQNNPVFFSKNNVSRPQAFIKRGTKTVCGSNCISKYPFNHVSASG